MKKQHALLLALSGGAILSGLALFSKEQSLPITTEVSGGGSHSRGGHGFAKRSDFDPESLQVRNDEAKPKGHADYPEQIAREFKLQGGDAIKLAWRTALEDSKKGETIRLAVGGDIVEGQVTQNDVYPGEGFRVTVELSAPEGRLSWFEIGPRAGGFVMFNDKSVSLKFAQGEAVDDLVATKSTVAEQLCVEPGAVFPLAHEANAAMLMAKSDEPLAAENAGDVQKMTVQAFSSRPDSEYVLYIDFDGEVVPAGVWGPEINAAPQPFSAELIRSIWIAVAEDFRPWDVNVTTDRAVFDSTPVSKRSMCVHTPTTTAAPGAGGVAFLDSFGDGSVCWAFNGGPIGGAVTVSHEYGHMFGLRHDGDTGREYYPGHGSGVGVWGTIMGASFVAHFQQWSQGEYRNSSNDEDDFELIGFYLDPAIDDHGDSDIAATPLDFEGGTIAEATGEVGLDDVDYFSFVMPSGLNAIDLSVVGVNRDTNLDVSLIVTDSSGAVVASARPTDSLSAELSFQTTPGAEYFLRIEGDGWGNPFGNPAQGWTDYGSMGFYRVKAALPSSLADAIDVGNDFEVLSTTPIQWRAVDVTDFVTDRTDAARTGLIGHRGRTDMELRVTGPATLKFKWQVSSENRRDYLYFIVNDEEIAKISGERTYHDKTHELGEGDHVILWSYQKDSSVFRGLDSGWVDQVQVIYPAWTGYKDWLENYDLSAELSTDDPDGDGILNVMEYFLEADPSRANQELSHMAFNAGPLTQASFQSRLDLTGLLYQIYGSSNLVDWDLLAEGRDNELMEATADGVTIIDGFLPEVEADTIAPRLFSIEEDGDVTTRFYQMKVTILTEIPEPETEE